MFHRNIKGSWGRRYLYFAPLPLVLESFKRCLLLLAALTGLIDTPLRSCYLEGLCYDCLWRGDKGCWHSNISSVQHRWPDLCHYIYCFVQSGKVFTVKGNIHTHTHIHTHTYIDAFEYLPEPNPRMLNKVFIGTKERSDVWT